MKLAALLAATAALALATPTDADACGGFFPRRTKTVPSLQVEQVLLLHDPAKEEEHFIRQIAFRDASEPFGFVVPTPTRPTVAKVDGSPFAALARAYPPELRLGLGGGGGGAPSGSGRGHQEDGAKVTVLSQERIGSFTAFVLAATDAGALEKWLKDNEFTTTPESAAWLQHYVGLGFYYAAFRYEPNPKKTPDVVSETVRISFSTPLPFYPYREPLHPEADPKSPRVLAVWLVTPARSVPVASLDARLQRPWHEDVTHAPATAAELGAVIGSLASLLPPAQDGHLVVQTFEDQKSSRQGWGDVVLVPEDAKTLTPARRAHAAKLTAAIEGR